MKLEKIIGDLRCPDCKGDLKTSDLRYKGGDIHSGKLVCEKEEQEYQISTSVPSFIKEKSKYPQEFLPPETIANPYEFQTLYTYPFLEILKYYGGDKFMEAVRTDTLLPLKKSEIKYNNGLKNKLNSAIKKKAYRASKVDFFKSRIIDRMWKPRLWKDEGFITMLDEFKKLGSKYNLDIATGPGGFVCKAAESNPSLVSIGLEIFFNNCRMVNSEANYLGFSDRIHLINGDARTLPFEDNIFDSVSGCLSLFHISYYEKAVEESHRVLKEGGSFIGTVHENYPSQSQGILTREEEEEFFRYAHLPLNLDEVIETFKNSGFKKVDAKPAGNKRVIIAQK